jgi:hypothetical protein
MASGAMYYLLIGPLYTGESTGVWAPSTNVKTLIAQRDEYDSTLQGIKPIIKEAKDLKALYEGIDDDTKRRLTIMVPDSINEIKLYAELARIAGESGIPAELGGKEKGSGEYGVSLTVLTNYEGFKKFITNYERSMRLFTLDSVTFIPSLKDEDVKFNVSLTTYYLNSAKGKK